MKSIAFAIVTIFALSSCAGPQVADRPNPLTYANVNNGITKGATTKNQILMLFGSPNITTKNAQNQDVWTYDKVGSESKSGDSYWTAILLGGERASAQQSASTTTLTVSFDERGIVNDYDFYQTRY